MYTNIIAFFQKLLPLLFILTITYIVYSLFSFLYPENILQSYMGIHRMLPDFADMRQLTHTSECNEKFINLINNFANCDFWERPFNYPELTLNIFRFFKINSSHSNLLGSFTGILLIVISCLYIFKSVTNKSNQYLLSIFFLLSYPTQLVIERGNYDQLILIFLIFLPYLSIKSFDKSYMEIIRFLLLGFITYFSIGLKIFPFVTILPWFLLLIYLKKLNKIFLYFSIILASIAFFSQFDYLDLILSNTPKSEGLGGFGLFASYPSYFGLSGSLLLTFLKLLFISSSVCIFYKKRLLEKILINKKSFSEREAINLFTALFFSFFMISIYFLSTSWDYRLIFSLGIFPYFLNELKIKSIKNVKYILLIIIPSIYIFYEQYFNFVQESFSLRLDYVLHVFSDLLIMPFLVGFLIYFLMNQILRGKYKLNTV